MEMMSNGNKIDQPDYTPALVVPKTKEKIFRLREFLKNEDAMEQISDHIAGGGSIHSMANVLQVNAHHVLRWIRADPTRAKVYETALVDRDEWEKESVLQQLRDIGTFDVRDIFNDDGTLKPISNWPESAGRAIEAIEVNEEYDKSGEHVGTAKRVKLINKLKALELTGKQLALFRDKIEHSGKVTLEELVGLDKDESAS